MACFIFERSYIPFATLQTMLTYYSISYMISTLPINQQKWYLWKMSCMQWYWTSIHWHEPVLCTWLLSKYVQSIQMFGKPIALLKKNNNCISPRLMFCLHYSPLCIFYKCVIISMDIYARYSCFFNKYNSMSPGNLRRIFIFFTCWCVAPVMLPYFYDWCLCLPAIRYCGISHSILQHCICFIMKKHMLIPFRWIWTSV